MSIVLMVAATLRACSLAVGLWFVDLYAQTFVDFWRGLWPHQWAQLPLSLAIYVVWSVVVTAVVAALLGRLAPRFAAMADVSTSVVTLAIACALSPDPKALWPALSALLLAAVLPHAMARQARAGAGTRQARAGAGPTRLVALVVGSAFGAGATLLLWAPRLSLLPDPGATVRALAATTVVAMLVAGLFLVRFARGRARLPMYFAWALIPLLSIAWMWPAGGSRNATQPNLLIVTADTLRAASVQPYGGLIPMPAFDTLAERGMFVRRYYSAAPWTIPSLGGLFTSRYPPGFSPGAGQSQRSLELTRYSNLGEYFLPDDSVIKRLRARGYRTAAFVTNPAMAFQDWLMWEFEHHKVTGATLKNSVRGWVESTPLLQAALRHLGAPISERPRDLTWLAKRYALDFLQNVGDQPFALWLHFVDPHSPYDPPTRFRFGPQVFDYVPHGNHPSKVAATARPVRDLYHGEIRYVDEAFGAILGELRERSMEENTVVVFSADHGEELMERTCFGHGHTLFEEQVRVPFAIAGPGVQSGVIDEPVSAIDVLPTLADLLQVAPSPHWRGRSWAARLRGQVSRLDARPVFIQATGMLPPSPEPLQAVVDGQLKLIRGIETGEVRLFDLTSDPYERKDVAGSRPEDVTRLRRRLDAWTASFPSTFDQFELPPPNMLQKASIEALRALGYAEPPQSPVPRPPLPR